MRTLVTGFAIIISAGLTAGAEPTRSLLERCDKIEYDLDGKDLDQGWKDRVALEFEIVNSADLKSLRTGLEDDNQFVRSLAARALGIRGDRESAAALVRLLNNDPSPFVRIRAVESLGLLKMKPKAIKRAKKDRDFGVQWVAELAEEQLESDEDFAGQMRRAFAVGVKREEMGLAQVGQPAPDFTAFTLDGKPFKLSSVLGKKPIAIYFAAFDC